MATRKLRTAHFLMFMGVLPMMFALALAAAGIAFAQAHPGQGGASDGFLMIALSLFGYLANLILGVTGALWSLYLTRHGIDQLATATLVLRCMVAAAVVLPPLLYLGMLWRFHLLY